MEYAIAGVALSATSFLLSPLVKITIDKIQSTLLNQLSKTFKGRIKELKTKMEDIHSKLRQVEGSGTLHANHWQQQIWEVNVELEDLLDDILIARSNQVPIQYFERVDAIKDNLGDLHKTFDDLREVTVVDESEQTETTSEFGGRIFIGREDEKKKILKFICSDSNTCSIVGMGGVGKTALAQVICDKVKEVGELEVIWVHVGFKKFKIQDILSKMLGERRGNNYTLQNLRNKLEEKLESKTCLIVLDELWDINPYEWDNLKGMLKGNKILITTRHQRIAEIVAENEPIFLKPLQPDDCLPIIRWKAGEANIARITDKIINECEGVPLAAFTLGVMLSQETITDSDIWSSVNVKEKGNIMNLLKFSYDHLPPPLQRCFGIHAICNDIVDKERLTQIWMAQGFVQQTYADTAFEELKKASFFHDVKEDIFTGTQFKVLKLFSHLAFLVSGEYKHTRTLLVSPSARHVHVAAEIQTTTFLGQQLGCLKTLRTYVGPCTQRLLKNFQRLRVLKLSCSDIMEIPSSIGDLKHLSYLEISQNQNLEKLPKSIGMLVNLKTLRVNKCENLKALPDEIRKLINLRHLYISSQQKSLELKRLCSLQTLHLENFNHLEKLPEMSGLTALESLGTLPLGLQESAQKLTSMCLSSCGRLTKLPEWFVKLTSLKRLTIERCPGIMSLANEKNGRLLPQNLIVLCIDDCPQLTRRYRRGEGEDWSKIGHVKEIYLDRIRIHHIRDAEFSALAFPSSDKDMSKTTATLFSNVASSSKSKKRNRCSR